MRSRSLLLAAPLVLAALDRGLRAWWAAAPPDICRPARHGAPEVVAGSGQTDHASLDDDQVLALERGPQGGGHHIWIAAGMKNLRQAGSTTTITSSLEGDPGPAPPLGVAWSPARPGPWTVLRPIFVAR